MSSLKKCPPLLLPLPRKLRLLPLNRLLLPRPRPLLLRRLPSLLPLRLLKLRLLRLNRLLPPRPRLRLPNSLPLKLLPLRPKLPSRLYPSCLERGRSLRGALFLCCPCSQTSVMEKPDVMAKQLQDKRKGRPDTVKGTTSVGNTPSARIHGKATAL